MQKIYRLTKRSSFSYIYKKGLVKSNKVLTLHFISATSIKVGVSVSKKIGKAVTRNLVKRRVKESFRKLIPEIKQKGNYIFVARVGIEALTFDEISREIKSLLKRAGQFAL